MSGLLTHIEKAVSHQLGQKSPIAPNGVALLIQRAIFPLVRNYMMMARALEVDFESLDWDKLPPLVRANIELLVDGVVGRIYNYLALCGSSFCAQARVLCSDTDIHPSFMFSCVMEVEGHSRFAYKSRDASCECFLSRLTSAAELDHYFYVPEIVPFAEGGYKQKFVLRSLAARPLTDELMYTMGRFTAVAQILGANDLHEENILFDGERFAVVDGETLFQSPRGSTKSGIGQIDQCSIRRSVVMSSVLATNLFTEMDDLKDRQILGCFTRFLVNASINFRGGLGCSAREIDIFISGYRSGREVYEIILAEIPSGIVVRKVLLPTAAYAGIVARESVESLYSSRDAFAGRIGSALNRLSDVYSGPVEAAANDLACSLIPFYQSRINGNQIEAMVRENFSMFLGNIEDNDNFLRKYLARSVTRIKAG